MTTFRYAPWCLLAGVCLGAIVFPTLVMAGAPTADVPADLAAGGTLVVAINASDPPFSDTDERGEPMGFNVDFARALCAALAATCRIDPIPFAEVLPAITRGAYDFAVANMLRTPARESLVDFTDRYLHSTSCFVGRPGRVAATTPEALRGLTLAAVAGSVQERWLRAHYDDLARITVYPTPAEANAALVAGKVDLTLAPTLANFGFLKSPRGQGFEIIGEPVADGALGGDVAIPLGKGRDALRQRLNAAIAGLLRDGTFDRIALRYFPYSIR